MSGTNTIINASLPVIIEVLEKTSWWRYNLRFGKRILSTKSQRELEIGELYFANVGKDQGGVININKLIKRQRGVYISGAQGWIERIVDSGETDFLFDELKTRLALCDDALSFDALLESLMALQKGIVSLPFVYNELFCLFQLRKNGAKCELYLLFSSFAPIIISIESGQIVEAQSPYASLSAALAKALKVKAVVADTKPFFTASKNILDFKG